LSALADALRLAAEELRARGADFALVGGLAVSARSEPRFTRDVDLAISVASDREAEALVRSFLAQGWRVLAQVEQEAIGRLATVRLAPSPARVSDAVVIDLLLASSGIEPEIVAAAEPLTVFKDVVVPVANVAHLLALKVLAQDDRTRPQDRIDARSLVAISSRKELDDARAALELIRKRGFHRGKDLMREFDELIAAR
jgi:predicted nucleotidyltransferase